MAGFSVLLVLLFGLTFYLAKKAVFADQSLPVILVGGIAMFLVALTVVVLVFQRLGLADPRFALALPDGSIRAFIALSLILLFFIVIVFFFFDSPSPARTGPIQDLTPEQFAAIPGDQLNLSFKQDDGNYTIIRNIPQSQFSQDFAKQVTTTISTLVVAIASFYFGASTVASATSGAGSTTGQTDAKGNGGGAKEGGAKEGGAKEGGAKEGGAKPA